MTQLSKACLKQSWAISQLHSLPRLLRVPMLRNALCYMLLWLTVFYVIACSTYLLGTFSKVDGARRASTR